MLYFHVLQRGLSLLPGANAEVRDELLKKSQEEGLGALHEQLRRIDPESAQRIHPNDPQRLLRALEVYKLTGRSLTEHYHSEKTSALLPYHVVNLVLAPHDRALLTERIAVRFQHMLEQGFVAEVERFFNRGDLTVDTAAMRAVGYRQAWNYLADLCSYNQMQEQAVVATRQLAKRQLTWLRSWEEAVWFDSEERALIHKVFREVSLQAQI